MVRALMMVQVEGLEGGWGSGGTGTEQSAQPTTLLRMPLKKALTVPLRRPPRLEVRLERLSFHLPWALLEMLGLSLEAAKR